MPFGRKMLANPINYCLSPYLARASAEPFTPCGTWCQRTAHSAPAWHLQPCPDPGSMFLFTIYYVICTVHTTLITDPFDTTCVVSYYPHFLSTKSSAAALLIPLGSTARNKFFKEYLLKFIF